jgi:hypothetical protein
MFDGVHQIGGMFPASGKEPEQMGVSSTEPTAFPSSGIVRTLRMPAMARRVAARWPAVTIYPGRTVLRWRRSGRSQRAGSA